MSCAHASMRFALSGCALVDARQETASAGQKRSYECVTCPERHEVHLVTAKAARYHEPAWFRHNGDIGQHSGGGPGGGGSGGGGESEQHWHAKFLLQSKVGSYQFVTACCRSCPVLKVYGPSSTCTVRVEESDPVAGYRYDAMVVENGFTTVLEVFHTHRTNSVKRKHVRDRGWVFAEFEAIDVIDKLERAKDIVTLKNLEPRPYLCQRCRNHQIRREAHEAWSRELQAEIRVWAALEAQLEAYNLHIIELVARRKREVYEAWSSELETEINVWAAWEAQLEAYNLRILELAERMVWLEPLWQMMACTGPRVAEIDPHGLAMIHDMDAVISVEYEWEQHHHRAGLRKYRHILWTREEEQRIQHNAQIKRGAFCRAEEKLQTNQAPRRRDPYIKGESIKCPECGWWVQRQGCNLIQEKSCARDWFAVKRFHYRQTDIWVHAAQ